MTQPILSLPWKVAPATEYEPLLVVTDDPAPYQAVIVCEIPNNVFREKHLLEIAQIIAEAGTVTFETNLMPRQIAEQRAELLAALQQAQRALACCARPTASDLAMSSLNAWTMCAEAEEKARAAIAKATKGN